MLLPYQILLPLLSLFLVRVDLTDLLPIKMEVKILKVLDGDTLEVARGSYRMRLRLSRLDSPEKGQPFIGSRRDAGHASRKCLSSLLKKEKKLVMKVEKYDIYGRILGEVNGINLLAIQKGCAGLYPHAQFSSRSERSLFVRSLNQARRQRRGVWASGGYRQPKLWRKSSKRSAVRR